MKIHSRFHIAVILCLVLFWSANAATADDEDAAKRDYNTTAALQNNGLYKRAAERWQDFLAKHPRHEWAPRAKYYLGICRLHEKQFAEAAQAFEEVLKNFPKFETRDGAQYNLGMAFYQQAIAKPSAEMFQKAATALKTTADQYPKSVHTPKALYYAGESYYSANQKDNAVTVWKKLRETGAKDAIAAEAAYSLAVALEELQKPTEATTALESFIKDFADHEYAAEVHLRLALLQFKSNEFAKAADEFGNAARAKNFLHADFAALRQAQCHIELRNTAEATKLLNAFLKDRPDSQYRQPAQLALGKSKHLAGQSQQAISLLQEAAKAESLAGEATWWLTRAYLNLKKPTDALKSIEAVSDEAKKGEFGPYLEFARIEAMQAIPEKSNETAALFEKFVADHPNHPMALQAGYFGALAALNNEDYASARRQSKALLANEKFAESEFRPTVLFISAEANLLGDEPKGASLATAEKQYRQLLTQFPNHQKAARAVVRIGFLLLQQEKYEEVIAFIAPVESKLKNAEDKAELALVKGRCLAKLGKNNEAATTYLAGYSAAPKWNRADMLVVGAADAFLAEGKSAEAKQQLDRLQQSFPQSPLLAQAHWRLGDIARRDKQYAAAAASFEKVISLQPEKKWLARALYSLASVQFAQAKFEATTSSIDRLLTEANEADITADARYLRGLAFQQLRKYEPAIADLQAFLATKPAGESLANAQYALALCRLGEGNVEEAIADLEKLANEPTDGNRKEEILYELSHAYLAQKESEKAAAAFTRLIERTKKPDLIGEAWFYIGDIREQAAKSDIADEPSAETMTQLASAADAFEQGLEAAKSAELREKLRHKLGFVFLRQNKFGESAAQLEMQLKEHPEGQLAGAAAFFAGEAYFRNNEFAKALPLLEQAIERKIDSNLANAYYRAGAAAAATNQWPKSHEYYETLLKQFPKFPSTSEAQYGVAFALFKQGKTDEAKTAFAKITDNSEAGAKAFFMRGEIAFEAKQYEQAIEHFLNVASGYPYDEWKGLARFEAARCLIELKKKPEAIALLNTLVQKQPEHAKVADAKALLQELTQ